MSRGRGKKLTKEQFVERARKVHGDLYDYTKINYMDNNTKIEIICSFHGSYWQRPDYISIICSNHKIFKQKARKHLEGSGCAKCTHESLKWTTSDFIEKAKKIHKNKYDYSKTIYKGIYEPIIIICPDHGEFEHKPSLHIYKKTGCIKCSNNYSHIENEWLDEIGIPDDKKHRQVWIIHGSFKCKVDGYLSKTKTVYDFYGDFWHGNPKVYDINAVNPRTKCTFGELYKKTIEREILLKNQGYKLVTMWEADFLVAQGINNEN